MLKSYTNRLFLRFPIIYRGRHDKSSIIMQEEIACGDGWFNLLTQLSRDIEAIANQMKMAGYDDDELPIALQVKEKFGGLRFYMANETSEIRVLIEQAQRTSFLLCEMCGEDGKGFDDDGWRRTVCEACKGKEE